MDFKQAETKFKQLKGQFIAGSLSEPEFKNQLEELMVQDEQGNWWMLGYETEHWYRHDGMAWLQANPPGGFSQKLKIDTFMPQFRTKRAAEHFASAEKNKPGTARKKSLWKGFLFHLFLGAGVLYAGRKSLRKWVYPLAIIFFLIGFSLGRLDLDYAMGGDIMSDDTALIIALIALIVYAAGFFDTWLTVRRVNKQTG